MRARCDLQAARARRRPAQAAWRSAGAAGEHLPRSRGKVADAAAGQRLRRAGVGGGLGAGAGIVHEVNNLLRVDLRWATGNAHVHVMPAFDVRCTHAGLCAATVC